MMRSALIVAGGKGARMGGETPKQFLPLAGKPILMRAIEAFHDHTKEIQIILVLHPDMRSRWEALCREYSFNIRHTIADGGSERYHSVKNGLEKVPEENLVAIHDGVRPLVSPRIIMDSFRLAEQFGSAVPVMPLNETIREIKEGSSRPVDRSILFSVQTPQTFQASLIKEAYRQEFRQEFTDDAAVLEATGQRLHFFPGDPRNIKITRPDDLVLAGSLV